MDAAETESLRLAIERSLGGTFDPADVVPRLARLARLAPPNSDHGVFANQKLGELLVERDPWRAALFVRRALLHRRGDDRSWALLAACQTRLGNFRCAASAYRRAIACAPSNPWHVHNLGHLLDVALGEPNQALVWLERAHAAKGDNAAIVASYVRALARAGQLGKARAVLEVGQRLRQERQSSSELEALGRWLDEGAPRGAESPTVSVPRARPTRQGALAGDETAVRRRSSSRRLTALLARGLSHLPFDARQRERALALAREARPSPPPPRSEPRADRRQRVAALRRGDTVDHHQLAALAAAVAYAIVVVDDVPLSQAEVAAPFRVGVAELRGRFAELRAKLDIQGLAPRPTGRR